MIGVLGTLLDYLRVRLAIRADAVKYARSLGVRVGDGCRFLGVNPDTFGSEPYLVSIGSHVTITEGVKFITHDGGVWVFRERDPDIEVFGPITVGTNVFIGMFVVLMPGVTIGDDCVIGAGAIVTHDIPSGSVAVGVPARRVRSIEEYHERVLSRATYVRSLPPDEKRRWLERRFTCQPTNSGEQR